MSKENTGLTRRRVLGGIVTVGAASAAVGAGTFAAFNDTETTDNTVTAGTLNLTAGGTDGSTFTVTVSDAKPGDDKTQATELVNDGSLGGSLDLKFSESTNLEGDDPEPEPSTTPNGDLGGELAVAISVGGTEVRAGPSTRSSTAQKPMQIFR